MSIRLKSSTRIPTKTIVAVVIGNALEWYDFVVYSFMATVIAKLFFPVINHANSLLIALATFGVAFFMRPFGGILIGFYADKYGRKAAMTLIIGIMTVAILLLALAPTYAQIGMAAPILIVVARLMQGFSAGGEFGPSTALLIELSPPNQHGYYGSWQMIGQMFSILIGSALGLLLTHFLNAQQMESYGFRIPFLFGLIIAPIGIYIRKHLNATHVDDQILKTKNDLSTVGHKIQQQFRPILLAMGLVVGGTVAVYANISYMPTYVSHYLNLSMNTAFLGLFIGVFIMLILMPMVGALSDRIGKKYILVVSLSIYFIVIYPLFSWLFHEPTLITFIIVQCIFCSLLAFYFGVFVAVVAELFPREIRSTALAISYNLTVMIFGGFAQFIVTWLINATHQPLAITYYLAGAIAISLIAALFYREKEDKEYHEYI